MKTTIELLHQEYTREYEFLYDNHCKGKEVAGERQAIDFFIDVIMKDYIDLVNDFNGYTNEIISSDREASAFVFACEKLGLLD